VDWRTKCIRRRPGSSKPSDMNFPHENPLYQGNHWNHPFQNQALAEADVILVIDSDVPWIPTVSKPVATAKIYHIDVDALREQMSLWHIGALKSCRADALTALRQLNACLSGMCSTHRPSKSAPHTVPHAMQPGAENLMRSSARKMG
jgi:thiamine pyrophosphate-dependent acetolactate synthase large subunit-like protein